MLLAKSAKEKPDCASRTTPENQNATSHLNLDSVEALNKLHPIDTDLKPSENTKFKKKFLDRLKKDKMGRIEEAAQGHRYNTLLIFSLETVAILDLPYPRS